MIFPILLKMIITNAWVLNEAGEFYIYLTAADIHKIAAYFPPKKLVYHDSFFIRIISFF